MKQLAAEVDAGLRELAKRQGCQVVSPRGEWYGFDPIHVRRRHRATAWSEMLSAWPGLEGIRIPGQSPFGGLRYWRLAPAERELWGRTRRAAQPAWRHNDGSTIWLY